MQLVLQYCNILLVVQKLWYFEEVSIWQMVNIDTDNMLIISPNNDTNTILIFLLILELINYFIDIYILLRQDVLLIIICNVNCSYKITLLYWLYTISSTFPPQNATKTYHEKNIAWFLILTKNHKNDYFQEINKYRIKVKSWLRTFNARWGEQNVLLPNTVYTWVMHW